VQAEPASGTVRKRSDVRTPDAARRPGGMTHRPVRGWQAARAGQDLDLQRQLANVTLILTVFAQMRGLYTARRAPHLAPVPMLPAAEPVHTAARATASRVSTAPDVRAAIAGDCTGAAMAGKMMQRLRRAVRCCPHAGSILSCAMAPESACERRKHHHDAPPKANRASRNVLNQGTTTSGCTIKDATKRVNRHVCGAPTRTRDQAQIIRRQALLFSPAGSSRSRSGDRPGGRSGREARARRGLWATDGQGTATSRF
jgi:hypothetical protein